MQVGKLSYDQYELVLIIRQLQSKNLAFLAGRILQDTQNGSISHFSNAQNNLFRPLNRGGRKLQYIANVLFPNTLEVLRHINQWFGSYVS